MQLLKLMVWECFTVALLILAVRQISGFKLSLKFGPSWGYNQFTCRYRSFAHVNCQFIFILYWVRQLRLRKFWGMCSGDSIVSWSLLYLCYRTICSMSGWFPMCIIILSTTYSFSLRLFVHLWQCEALVRLDVSLDRRCLCRKPLRFGIWLDRRSERAEPIHIGSRFCGIYRVVVETKMAHLPRSRFIRSVSGRFQWSFLCFFWRSFFGTACCRASGVCCRCPVLWPSLKVRVLFRCADW